MRQCIRRSQRVDDLEQEIDRLETEVERLKREKRLVLEQREENTQLANYAEQQRTRQQLKDDAGIVQRAKWFVFGMGDDVDSADQSDSH